MSQRRLSLAEIKQKIRNPAKPVKPVTPANLDDKELFRQAVAGARQLAPDDHAQTGRPLPPPVPRPRAKDAAPEPVRQQRTEDWVPATWLTQEAPPAQAENLHPDLASALRGVTPIETDRVSLDLPKPRPQPIQRDRDEQAALLESIYAPTSLELHLEGGEELTHLVNGVPQSTLRDLRRGRWVIQDQVDLHGCNRDEARDLLAACMAQWKKRGIRCVRVIHGKGRGSPGREPVLKKLVAGWLRNYEDVMAYCQARLPDGGAGALIVLLRASRTTSLL